MTRNELRSKRRRLDITQAELAKAAGVTRGRIGHIESGNPEATEATILRLNAILNRIARERKKL